MDGLTSDEVFTYIQPVDPAEAARPWVVLGATVQGTGHLLTALPCQDAFAFRVMSDDTLVVAVADGLGTAALAHTGAWLAVNGAVDWFATTLADAAPEESGEWRRWFWEGFGWVRSRLEADAQANQLPLRDYATTLLVAVIAGEWLAIGHIGDGAVVAQLADGEVVTVSPPQNGEYANQTLPLTLPMALETAQFEAWQVPVAALALFTDGLQYLAIHHRDHSPHVPFFMPLFRQLPGVTDAVAAARRLADFLASGRVCAHTDDDKTLVLVGRKLSQAPL
jgi:hypothetical protein